MRHFQSAREAKEFLVSKIVEEAQRENVVLSETERKMLFFSETEWTLPDMEAVSDEFDRCFSQNEYEKKVSRLIRSAYGRAGKELGEQYDSWWDAVRLLSKEDHYLTVIIRRAGLRPRGDLLRLWATGTAIVTAFVAGMFLIFWLSEKYKIDFGKYAPTREKIGFYGWVAAIGVVVVYQMLRFIVGGRRVDEHVLALLERIFPTLRTRA